MNTRKRFFYDLHIHSCLSPCADADMSVNNIVNMSRLKSLDLIALTDHNSCRNVIPLLKLAADCGIKALAGMELTTSEEIHAVCLFRDVKAAIEFDAYVWEKLPDIKNKPSVFGEQLVLNEKDEIIGSEEKLLLTASGISIYELPELMSGYGGFWFPAHIDRPANSLLENLGLAPEDIEYHACEYSGNANTEEIYSRNPVLKTVPRLCNSDAHYLWQISEAENILPQELSELID